MLRRPSMLFVLCALITTLAIPLLGTPPLPRRTGPAQKTSSSAIEERIHRVETGIVSIPLDGGQAPLQFNLQQLMEALKVPGLSVAVIDDFKLAWTKVYGVKEVGASAPVDTKTLFQA